MKEVGSIGEDAGNGDEGDDEDWVRNSSCSSLKVMLTGCEGTESWSENGDMYEVAEVSQKHSLVFFKLFIFPSFTSFANLL